MHDTVTQAQVLRSLSITLFTLNRATGSCDIGEASDLPQAFPVVAKHLSLIFDIFTRIEKYLKASGEKPQHVIELFPELREVAEKSCKRVSDLEDLYDTVTRSDDYQAKIKAYRQRVMAKKDQKVEDIMSDMLSDVTGVAVEPLVTSEDIEKLQAASEELEQLPPSLDDGPQGGMTFINNSSGMQVSFSGKGAQNICSGGFQVTGSNQHATYNYSDK